MRGGPPLAELRPRQACEIGNHLFQFFAREVPLALEILYRFLVGGAIVSAFSLLGGLFRQRSFAGLFSAAPSVALATLSLTILHSGTHYASIKSRSMIAGAAGFFVYACAVTVILARYSTKTLVTTSACLALWLATSLGLWYVFLR